MSPREVAALRERSSATRHVAAGALIGAGVYGLGLLIYFSQTSDEFLGHPAAIVPAGLGAAALGGLIGSPPCTPEPPAAGCD